MDKPTVIDTITTTREELFDISDMLAEAIAPFLRDRARPVVIAVNGSLESGKKIIADGLRERLLSSASPAAFTGREGYDEYWKGVSPDGSPVEMTYLDAGWRSQHRAGYHSTAINPRNIIGAPQAEPQSFSQFINAFLSDRSAGGVSVIQNTEHYGEEEEDVKPDVEVWIQRRHHVNIVGPPKPSRLPERGKLTQDFKALDDSAKSWARFVRITVFDQRLKETDTFKGWEP